MAVRNWRAGLISAEAIKTLPLVAKLFSTNHLRHPSNSNLRMFATLFEYQSLNTLCQSFSLSMILSDHSGNALEPETGHTRRAESPGGLADKRNTASVAFCHCLVTAGRLSLYHSGSVAFSSCPEKPSSLTCPEEESKVVGLYFLSLLPDRAVTLVHGGTWDIEEQWGTCNTYAGAGAEAGWRGAVTS